MHIETVLFQFLDSFIDKLPMNDDSYGMNR